MSFLETAIIFQSAITAFSAIPFFYFRNKMAKSPNPENFSEKRLLKITIINLILNSVIAATFLFIFAGLELPLTRLTDPKLLALSIAFLFTISLTYYGNGIYIASVVIETFTRPELRKNRFFKTEFLATNSFHGPISHILVFSGYIVTLAILCIIDLQLNREITFNIWVVITAGIALGLAFTYSQIQNGTAPFQVFSTIAALIVIVFYALANHLPIEKSVTSIYFVAFSTSFLFLGATWALFGWKRINVWKRWGYRELNIKN